MKMEAQIRLINIDDIIPNRFQPRLEFEESALNDLAASIKEHGIFQPLVVRRIADKFEIIAGERRFKAAKIAGLTAVPCIISDLDDNESAEVAIIENTHRRDLSPIEEAKSYKKLLDRRYVTQDQLATRLGISQSTIANKIRLLSLDENVQDALMKERISERHARSLLKVTDKMKQVDLLNKIISERWTVKRLDDEIDIINGSYTKSDGNGIGGINTNSKIDINVEDIINNSIDFITDGQEPLYTYQNNKNENKEPKKNSLFFNNLENEAANMDPTLSFGFNPFKSSNLDEEEEEDDEELELLDPSDEVEKEPEKIEEPENVVEKVIEATLEKNDDIVAEIKKIINKSKANGLGIESEEFSFDDMYQFVIRIDKEDK